MAKILFALLAAASLEAQASLRYTAELEELRELRQRLVLAGPEWRFLAIDAREGLEPTYQEVGLSSPYLTAGPLVPCGLLSQLGNPLGYSTGSEVFRERTGFRLDGSLDGASRRGFQLEPLPGRMALFAVRAPAGLDQAGGVLRFGPPAAEAEILTSVSLPAPEAETEDWFTDRSWFPGGALAHFGFGTELNAERGAERLSLYLDGALSGGQRVEPGAFLQLQAGLGRPCWTALALLGWCADDYRTPTGGPGAYSRLLGGRLQIERRPGKRICGSWLRRIGFAETVDRAVLVGEARWSPSARNRARLTAGAEGALRIQPDGARTREASGYLDFCVSNAAIEGAIRIEGGWKECLLEKSLELAAELRRKGFLVRAGVKSLLSEEPSAFADIELSGKGRFVFLHLREEAARLGWSVAQPLSYPQSPTRRISRSKGKP